MLFSKIKFKTITGLKLHTYHNTTVQTIYLQNTFTGSYKGSWKVFFWFDIEM